MVHVPLRDRANGYDLIEPSHLGRKGREKPRVRPRRRQRRGDRRHVQPRHRPAQQIVEPRCVIRQHGERRPLAWQAHSVDPPHPVRVSRPEVEPTHVPNQPRSAALARRRRQLLPVTHTLPHTRPHDRRGTLERSQVDGRAVQHAPRRPRRKRDPPPLGLHDRQPRATRRVAPHTNLVVINHGWRYRTESSPRGCGGSPSWCTCP